MVVSMEKRGIAFFPPRGYHTALLVFAIVGFTHAMAGHKYDTDSGKNAYNYGNGHIEDKEIHIASTPEAQSTSGPAPAPNEREDKATRKLIRKVDVRLLPVLAVRTGYRSKAEKLVFINRR